MSQGNKVDIFAYHDAREFLNSWVNHHKAHDKSFSLRKLSQEAQLSHGLLALILSKKRGLSSKTVESLIEIMKLSDSEASYFRLIRILSESKNRDDVEDAYRRVQRFQSYRIRHPREFETYRYISHWYYPIIREMISLDHFELDPKWIQARLSKKLPLAEVERAIEFLLRHGYIEKLKNGKVDVPEKRITCDGGVFRLAMAKFHKDMMDLASDSITTVDREYRNVESFTVSIDKDNFNEVRQVMNESMKKVMSITSKSKKKESVYHITFFAFPVLDSTKSR